MDRPVTQFPMSLSTEPMVQFDCEWKGCTNTPYAFTIYGCLDGHTAEIILCSNHYDQWITITRTAKCDCGLTIAAIDAIGVRAIHSSWITDLLRDQAARKVQEHFKQQKLPSVFPSPGQQKLVNIGSIRNKKPPNFKNMEEMKKYYSIRRRNEP
jgi:hypothetical protein